VRRLFLILLIAATARAEVVFVSPQEGAQAFGPAALEVTTTAQAVDRVDFFVDGVLAGVARKPPYRIAYDFGTSMNARTITARVWTNGFKTSESASVITAALTANDTLDVDLVEVAMRVRTPRELKASDVRLHENGVEQTIRDVRRERPSAHFAFVVDRSLSMNGGKLEAALRAVQNQLPQLRDGDSASLVLFNHNVARPRALHRGDSLEHLDLVPSGGTSLRDTKTIVSAIVMGDSHARFLDRAAENTGGSVTSANKSSVDAQLARVLADINSRYLVVYQSHGTQRGWRAIDVRPRRSGIEIVSARKGYFAK
jgi:hypothetical protein